MNVFVAVVAVVVVVDDDAASATTYIVPRCRIDLIIVRYGNPHCYKIKDEEERRKGAEKRNKKEEKSEIDAVLFIPNCC